MLRLQDWVKCFSVVRGKLWCVTEVSLSQTLHMTATVATMEVYAIDRMASWDRLAVSVPQADCIVIWVFVIVT